MTFQLYGIIPIPAWLAVTGIFAYDTYSAINDKVYLISSTCCSSNVATHRLFSVGPRIQLVMLQASWLGSGTLSLADHGYFESKLHGK